VFWHDVYLDEAVLLSRIRLALCPEGPRKNLNVDKEVRHYNFRLILTLHEDGYVYDFHLLDDLKVCCLQECSIHSFEEITINKIGLCRNSPKKLLIAIETAGGLKGLLITVFNMECFALLKKEGLLSKTRLVEDAQLQLV